ncbi:MAG: hypothetical protein QS748_09640 [Candidatus Endonucleobacter bathymodioli]|uniref:Uncharacterized protein n=1 Tax=Candidatus Endonucleibacter bathymodioli TaxID=539814 RepID=A0AA90STA4_9GAMM|nr:hypothetical protein [Candidatus Endonucleobacter bathymodioli]
MNKIITMAILLFGVALEVHAVKTDKIGERVKGVLAVPSSDIGTTMPSGGFFGASFNGGFNFGTPSGVDCSLSQSPGIDLDSGHSAKRWIYQTVSAELPARYSLKENRPYHNYFKTAFEDKDEGGIMGSKMKCHIYNSECMGDKAFKELFPLRGEVNSMKQDDSIGRSILRHDSYYVPSINHNKNYEPGNNYNKNYEQGIDYNKNPYLWY